jgi:hypothetical protein
LFSQFQNPNITHCESLIDAELAALEGHTHLAIKHYEVAILLAGRRGFTNDQALAHERFGDYMMERGDLNDAAYHLRFAIRLYEDWGASAKASQMKAKHAPLLAPPTEIRLGESSTVGLEKSMLLSTHERPRPGSSTREPPQRSSAQGLLAFAIG